MRLDQLGGPGPAKSCPVSLQKLLFAQTVINKPPLRGYPIVKRGYRYVNAATTKGTAWYFWINYLMVPRMNNSTLPPPLTQRWIFRRVCIPKAPRVVENGIAFWFIADETKILEISPRNSPKSESNPWEIENLIIQGVSLFKVSRIDSNWVS